MTVLGLDSEHNDIKATYDERVAMGSGSILDLIVSGELPASDEVKAQAQRVLDAAKQELDTDE